jgi:Tol biopolymer transport system component
LRRRQPRDRLGFEMTRGAWRVLFAALVLFGLIAATPAPATFSGPRGPIVFQRITDPRDEASGRLFRIGPNGGPLRPLTGLRSFFPDYSPDGRRIAFHRGFLDGSPDAIFTMSADGSDRVRLPTGCTGECLADDAPAWSPSGRRIVFERAFGPIVNDNASEVDLVVARADGSGAHVIRRFRITVGGREVHSPQWSPDGRHLAVTVLNTTARPRLASAIYVLDADGGNLRRVTPLRLNAGNPDWSPNGKRIVFNSSYEAQAAVEIYTVRPNGRGLQRLRHEPRGSYSFDPVWSPDGRRIAFVHGRGRGLPHIWTMRRDGGHLLQVTGGPRPDFSPDWGERRR